MIFWAIVVCLLITAIYDWTLYRSGKETISQWYHKQFPQWVDSLILIVLGVMTWWLFSERVFAIWAIGVIAGHLFWHED